MSIQCLIVDRDQQFRNKMGESIKTFSGDFEVQIAETVIKATWDIMQTDFSLLLCEPVLADFSTRLVPFIMEKRPAMPLLITDSADSPHSTGLHDVHCVKGFISRPVRMVELAGKVVMALGNTFYQGNVQGVDSISFLQIPEMELNDCLVRLVNTENNVEGLAFFKGGSLIDAVCGTLEAGEAVKQILAWPRVDVDLYNICPLKKNRINETVATFILHADRPQKPGKASPPKKSGKPAAGGLAGLYLKKTKKK